MWPFRPSTKVQRLLKDPRLQEIANDGERKVLARHLAKVSQTTAERILATLCRQAGGTLHDPLDDDPAFEEVLAEVQNEIDAQLGTEPRMGKCHSAWKLKKRLLAEQGIEWLSPAELNPWTRFD